MKEADLIERGFKIRWGVKFFLLVTGGMTALGAFLYIVTGESLGTSYGEAVYAVYNLRINIFSLAFASFYSIFILAFVTIAAGVISILYSHRLAGPMYRLEKDLQEIGSGDLTVHTRFRATDELKLLAEESNAMVRSLNHRARCAGDAVSDMGKAVDALTLLLEEESPDPLKVREAVAQLGESLEGLKKAAAGLRLKS